MMNNKKTFSLRVDSMLLQKFRFLSTIEGRSANNQALKLIQTSIETYEKEHGEIIVDE